MSEPTEQWERGVLETLASGVLREQRAARRWKIFFRLLTFFYIGVVLVILLDLRGKTELTGTSKHTALVDVSGIIGPGADASAEKINAALQAAFKDGVSTALAVALYKRKVFTTKCVAYAPNIPISLCMRWSKIFVLLGDTLLQQVRIVSMLVKPVSSVRLVCAWMDLVRLA
jgi:hypothetical protein